MWGVTRLVARCGGQLAGGGAALRNGGSERGGAFGTAAQVNTRLDFGGGALRVELVKCDAGRRGGRLWGWLIVGCCTKVQPGQLDAILRRRSAFILVACAQNARFAL